MNFKKLFGKSKTTPAPAPLRAPVWPPTPEETRIERRARVRRSRSMPFRSSSETDESDQHVPPVYRGQRPLKPSDVQLVLDISANAADSTWYDRYPVPPKPHVDNNNYSNKEMLDLFPAPPANVPQPVTERSDNSSHPARRPRPAPLNFISGDDLLPPLPPNVVAHNERLRKEREREQRRWDREHGRVRAHHQRLVPVRRSISSASGYYTSNSTNNPNDMPNHSQHSKPAPRHEDYVYPSTFTNHPDFSAQHLGANAQLKSGPSRQPIVKNSLASPTITSHPDFSAQMVGANVQLKSGPISRQPIVKNSLASASTANVATIGVEAHRPRTKSSKSSMTPLPMGPRSLPPVPSLSNIKFSHPIHRGEYGQATPPPVAPDPHLVKAQAATYRGTPERSHARTPRR